MEKKTVKLILNVLKYVITAVLGYLGGDGTLSNAMSVLF